MSEKRCLSESVQGSMTGGKRRCTFGCYKRGYLFSNWKLFKEGPVPRSSFISDVKELMVEGQKNRFILIYLITLFLLQMLQHWMGLKVFARISHVLIRGITVLTRHSHIKPWKCQPGLLRIEPSSYQIKMLSVTATVTCSVRMYKQNMLMTRET
jgi:hypothetical protein